MALLNPRSPAQGKSGASSRSDSDRACKVHFPDRAHSGGFLNARRFWRFRNFRASLAEYYRQQRLQLVDVEVHKGYKRL